MPHITDKVCVWDMPLMGCEWVRESAVRGGVPMHSYLYPYYVPSYLPDLMDSDRVHVLVSIAPGAWYRAVYLWLRREPNEAGPYLADILTSLDTTDVEQFILRNIGCYSKAKAEYQRGLKACIVMEPGRQYWANFWAKYHPGCDVAKILKTPLVAQEVVSIPAWVMALVESTEGFR